MQISFVEKSKVSATTVNVRRVMIYPRAEDGAGVLAMYGDNGQILGLMLLNSFDNAVLYDDPSLTPELAALLPAPIITKESTDGEATE